MWCPTPAIIGTLLRDRPDAMRRTTRSARAFQELGTTGVFNAEGEEWRRQRKLVMRALTPEVIRNFFPTLVMLTERLLARWQSAVGEGRRVDVLRDLKAWTLDVTIALAMGQDIDTLEHPDNPLQSDIEQIFNRVARRLTTPFSYWRYFKLPVDRAADAASARIEAAVTAFVAQARERLEANPSLRAKPTNLLEAFVAARDEPDSGFTDANVIGNAVTMVFAGEDTTSNTIAWLMNFVAQDARVAGLLASEADAELGGSAVLGEFAALDRFAYLDAAVDEAMRIKPVAPFLGLETNRDTVIGDVMVPARTPVLILTRMAGMVAADFPDLKSIPPGALARRETRGRGRPGEEAVSFRRRTALLPGALPRAGRDQDGFALDHTRKVRSECPKKSKSPRSALSSLPYSCRR